MTQVDRTRNALRIASAIAVAGVLSVGTSPLWAQSSRSNSSQRQSSESRAESHISKGLIAAEDLKGHEVVDAQNKKVGEIENLFIDMKTGKVERADIDFSIGDGSTHSVTWDKLKVKEQAKKNGEEKQMVVTLDESVVKRMQEARNTQSGSTANRR